MNLFRLFSSTVLMLFLSVHTDAMTLQKPDPTGNSFTVQQKERFKLLNSYLDKILSVKENRTIENTLQPYKEMSIILGNGRNEASVFANSHPNEAIRTHAFKSIQELSKFYTEKILLNRELYEALSQVKVDKSNSELYRYYSELIRTYKRSGVDRDKATREKVSTLLQEITEASQIFGKNLQEDVRTIYVKPEDLKGLPQDYIDSRKQKNGYVKISTDYPDSRPIFAYAESNAVRHQMYKNVRSRGYPKNKEPLKLLLEKRYKLAQLLGYRNWAEYATEDKMVKKPENVDQFLSDMIGMTRKLAKKDYQILLSEKRRIDSKATKVNEWERSYLENKYKKRALTLDSQEIRQYFAFENVKSGVFRISEKLFGIEIKPVGDAKAWHPDVNYYQVLDQGKVIGYFYLDMFPRSDKFKHAAQFTFRSGYQGVQLPVAVLMCNFPQPQKADSALMEHSQVETFLHEFGHLLHSIFSGHHMWPSSLEWDFIEAPSQLLEEWVWDKEALHLFARHYKTKEPIPEHLIVKMNNAAKLNLGLDTLSQLHYASLSLGIYNKDPKSFDILALNKKIKSRISLFPYVEGTYFPYGFGHLTGYASNYYTYMWSKVIAKDMFSKFQKSGIFSPKVAARYREKILTNSGTRSANQLVKEFLERDYNVKAYADWLTK